MLEVMHRCRAWWRRRWAAMRQDDLDRAYVRQVARYWTSRRDSPRPWTPGQDEPERWQVRA